MLEDKIDAVVWPPLVWPFMPEPDFIDLRGPLWVMFQEPLGENLESFAVVTVGPD